MKPGGIEKRRCHFEGCAKRLRLVDTPCAGCKQAYCTRHQRLEIHVCVYITSGQCKKQSLARLTSLLIEVAPTTLERI